MSDAPKEEFEPFVPDVNVSAGEPVPPPPTVMANLLPAVTEYALPKTNPPAPPPPPWRLPPPPPPPTTKTSAREIPAGISHSQIPDVVNE
jgi:hypothetical protein